MRRITQPSHRATGGKSHLSRRCCPRSRFQYSRRWSGSSPPYTLRCSCRGCCRTVSPSLCYTTTWCRSYSGTELSAGCPCCVRRWTDPARSPRSRSWAWRSRAPWGAPGPPGCRADPPDKGLPPGPRSHFPRWLWRGYGGCLLRWCL